MNNPSVAIIIPVQRFNDNLKKNLEKCLELDYANFEIIVLPDEPFSGFEGKIKVVSTGNIGPALKRDEALKHSEAEIFAFLDDDAYPEPDWLKNAVRHFAKEKVAAVGGPAITPRESSFMATASGICFSSLVVSGNYVYRYIPVGKIREVDDYPSCNFLVRRSIFKQLGGFNNKFWPGEDTKLCLDITKKLGKKIIYDPAVLVQHHRRNLGIAHFKQVANYGLHRGYFAKRFPETSLRVTYFLPGLFVIYLISGAAAAIFNQTIRLYYAVSMLFYLVVVFSAGVWGVCIRKEINFFNKLKLILPVSGGIILTHIVYGLYFIQGLLSNKLKEE